MCICSKLWNSVCLWSPWQLDPGPKGLVPPGTALTSDKRWGLRLGSQHPRSISARKQTVTAPGGHHRVQNSISSICDIKAISFLTHSYCLFHFLKYNSSILKNNLHIVRFTYFRYIVWWVWATTSSCKKKKKQHNQDVNIFFTLKSSLMPLYRWFFVPTPSPRQPIICFPSFAFSRISYKWPFCICILSLNIMFFLWNSSMLLYISIACLFTAK